LQKRVIYLNVKVIIPIFHSPSNATYETHKDKSHSSISLGLTKWQYASNNLNQTKNTKQNNIYLSKSLFVCHDVEVSQTTTLPVMFLVPLESPWWIKECWVRFIMFQPMMDKVLNIEQKFQWKFILIKKIKSREFGHAFIIVGKPSMNRN